MSRLTTIPDLSTDAERLVEEIEGHLRANRRDLAVNAVKCKLGIEWGQGWLNGMGNSIEDDRAALGASYYRDVVARSRGGRLPS